MGDNFGGINPFIPLWVRPCQGGQSFAHSHYTPQLQRTGAGPYRPPTSGDTR